MALTYQSDSKNIENRLKVAHNSKQAIIRGQFFEAEYNFFKKHIKNKKVLVAGSGLGHDSFKLAKYNKQVIGIELLNPLVKIAKVEAQKRKLKNTIFKKGDIRKLPYKEDYFDVAVLNMGTIGNFEDKEIILKEILRVAKIVYFDFYPPSPENLKIRKKLYSEELWRNVRIKGTVIVSDDGLESVSLTTNEIDLIVNNLGATVKYYPITSYSKMAELRK